MFIYLTCNYKLFIIIISRFNLKDNDIILADPQNHDSLIEAMIELASGDVEYTAGGAGLNSLRCAQVLN